MKKICLLVFFGAVALLLPSVNVWAQESYEERLAPVYELRDTFLKLIPYHDKDHLLTIERVSLDVDEKFMRLTISLDTGAKLKEADWYLDYLTHQPLWSLAPLGEHAFNLRLMVRTEKLNRKGSGGASYNYDFQDILQALQPPLWKQARDFIGAYARHVSQTLPYVSGEGETMVGCCYDGDSRVMTTTFQYEVDLWPEVKQYLEGNLGAVRKERARALVADTATSLAFAAYKGDVTLEFVFRSGSSKDSVVMVIPPWMWESVYEPRSGQKSDTLKMVQYIADEVDRQCPTTIDGGMTLVSCRLDTAARVLVYSYMVEEPVFRRLEHDKANMQSLRLSVEQAFRSTSGRVLGKYVTAAGVRVEYRYRSTASTQPIVVEFSPLRIKEILEKN